MPKNCSKDVSLVIEYVDDILKKGTPAEQKELKSMFGLEAVEHAGDFGKYGVHSVYLLALLMKLCIVLFNWVHGIGRIWDLILNILLSTNFVMLLRWISLRLNGFKLADFCTERNGGCSYHAR